MPTDPRDLKEHLRYYAEMGVAGFSRDGAWRARTVSGAAAVPVAAAVVEPRAEAAAPPGAERAATPAVAPAPPATRAIPVVRSHEHGLASVRADLGDCT